MLEVLCSLPSLTICITYNENTVMGKSKHTDGIQYLGIIFNSFVEIFVNICKFKIIIIIKDMKM